MCPQNSPLPNLTLSKPSTAIEDDREEARARKRQRLQSRKSLGTDSTPTDMSVTSVRSNDQVKGSPSVVRPPAMNQNQLKEHYKICINLSTTNKIDSKNAFGLHIIDYLNHLVKGNMNFSMATSALDAGTKIYVNRVDVVHSDAQKVANAILQALDTKGKKGKDDNEDEDIQVDPENQEEVDEETKRKRKEKTRKRRKGKCIATNEESLLLTKLETNPEFDPIFHQLTTSHDMENINGFFMTNLNVDAFGSLIVDSDTANPLSAQARKSVEERLQTASQANQAVTLDKPFVDLLKDCGNGCGSSIRKRHQENKNNNNNQKSYYRILADKFLNDFMFARREDDLDVSYKVRDKLSETSHWDHINADVSFRDNEEMAEETRNPHLDIFDDIQDSDDDLLMDEGNHNRLSTSNIASLQRTFLSAVNMESLPDLKKLLSSEDGEYSYFKNLGVIGSWAGPKFWRSNLWLKMKRLRELRAAAAVSEPVFGEDGEPLPSTSVFPAPTTSRKKKTEIPVQDYTVLFASIDELHDSLSCSKTQHQTLKRATLDKWKENAEMLGLPSHQHFHPSSLLRPFSKPLSFFSIVDERERAAKDARLRQTSESQDDDRRSTIGSLPPSPAPFDAIGDDLPASQAITDDQLMLPSQGTTFNPFGTQTVATGFNLVDEPDSIRHVVIPFAKYAKRMDVKRLKRALFNRIEAGVVSPEDSFNGPSQEPEGSAKLTQVYVELPREIPLQMTKDMSPAIAFVTLLHLANEKVSSTILQSYDRNSCNFCFLTEPGPSK